MDIKKPTISNGPKPKMGAIKINTSTGSTPVNVKAKTDEDSTPKPATEPKKGGLFSNTSEKPVEEEITVIGEASDDKDVKTEVTDNKEDKKKTTKKKDDKGFKVPLRVYAYDRELFVIDDPKTTEEAIRKKAAEECELFEMVKGKTEFIYNDDRDRLKLRPSFAKKG